MTFHRIVPGFVIQGGDPQGTVPGGPGYRVVEAPPKDLKYVEGVVAMAKTGARRRARSGSQFFVVTGPSAAQLPPDYALLGQVTGGQDVVAKIDAIISDPNTDAPEAPVVIESIRVSEQLATVLHDFPPSRERADLAADDRRVERALRRPTNSLGSPPTSPRSSQLRPPSRAQRAPCRCDRRCRARPWPAR